MMTAAAFWEFISHQGTHDKLSPQHYKSVVLTNQISVTAALAMIPLTALYYWLGIDSLFVTQYVTFALLLACVGFNAVGESQWWYYRIAKIILYFTIIANVFYTASTLGYESGIHLLYYPVVLGVILFYSLHRRLLFLVPGLAIPLLCIAVLEITDYSVFAMQGLSYRLLHFMYYLSLVSSVVFSLLFGFYYNTLIMRQQQSLLTTRQQLEAIFENSYDAMLLVDPRTDEIQACNRKAVVLFGLADRHQIMGRKSAGFQRRELQPRERRQVLQMLRRRGRWVQDRELVTARGEAFWGEVGITWISVKRKGMCLVRITDITQKRAAETQLRKKETALREAQRLARIGSFEFDLSTGKGEVSEELHRIFETRTNQPFTWERLLERMEPGHADTLTDLVRQSAPPEADIRLELRGRQAVSGGLLHLQLLGKMTFDEAGQPRRIMGILQDISERKRREIELIEAKSLAEQASVAKEQFLATMSHEIRTPINAILGMSHYLLQDDPKPEQIENLEILQFSAENLLLLVNDILDLNKIEAGRIRFEEIEFSLREVLGRIQQTHAHAATEKNLHFLREIDDTLPATVVGDPVRLAQVLNNLVSNAVKFTPKGWVKLRADLNRQDAEFVEINFSVEDSGIGIPSDKLDYIFERFTQASSDTTRMYGGTGLGLSITKRLLELQNSIIYVKSQVGAGSGFYFTLRLRKAASQKNIAFRPTAEEDYLLQGARVLIVEDNEINRLVTAKFLERWRIECDYAPNGRIAIDKVKTGQYDLILMDLQMPEMNGYDTTRQIRQYSQVPVLAVTATPAAEMGEKIQESGINDYVLKPFQPDDLLRKINRFVKSDNTRIPAQETLVVAGQDVKPTFAYRRILELTQDNDEYRVLLTQSYIRLLRQLKLDYEKNLLAGDLAQLRFMVSYVGPPFTFLEVTGVKEEVMFGIRLIEKSASDLKALNRSVQRLQAACDYLLRELEDKLLMAKVA
ncbi:MAG: response regulator [Cytophagales bacterium]|jgi:PAS domain S-box-containing protein|nr:response regulator [Cytophagales bacterium]